MIKMKFILLTHILTLIQIYKPILRKFKMTLISKLFAIDQHFVKLLLEIMLNFLPLQKNILTKNSTKDMLSLLREYILVKVSLLMFVMESFSFYFLPTKRRKNSDNTLSSKLFPCSILTELFMVTTGQIFQDLISINVGKIHRKIFIHKFIIWKRWYPTYFPKVKLIFIVIYMGIQWRKMHLFMGRMTKWIREKANNFHF